MSEVKVTFLGTAAGIPTRERAHPAIHFSYDDGEESCFLFDCGEGAQRQLLLADLNLMKIDDVFISHWHGDHCFGLPGLVDTMGFDGRERPLSVYAPDARRIKKCLGFNYSSGVFKVISKNVKAKGSRITCVLEKERFSIVSVPVKHSIPTVAYALIEKDKKHIDIEKARALGLPEKSELYKELKEKGEAVFDGRKVTFDEISSSMRGKKIVYSGDTEICDNLMDLIRDADLLIQDCTYMEEMPAKRTYKHASFMEVVKMVEEQGVKRTVLTHISRKYKDLDSINAMAEKYPAIEVAKDFLKVTI